MDRSRRDLLLGLSGLGAGATLAGLDRAAARLPPASQPATFPRKADFRIAEGYTYLNGAYTHPIPIAAAEAYRAAGGSRWRTWSGSWTGRPGWSKSRWCRCTTASSTISRPSPTWPTPTAPSSTPTSSRAPARCRSTSAPPGSTCGASLPYLLRLGVANIQRHRQPMIDRLQRELPRLGFTPQTPLESTGPIVTFAHRGSPAIERNLARARVDIRVAPHWIRIAPSVFNDLSDVDRLLDALS